MNLLKKNFQALSLLFFAALLIVSCQKEMVNSSNTKVAKSTQQLLNRSNANSNKNNDIFCFAFVYPIQVSLPNGSSISANNDEELEKAIEDWYKDKGEDAKDPSFVYPFQVTMEDKSTKEIKNEEAFDNLLYSCLGDDYGDYEECPDDNIIYFEYCYEFVFPFTIKHNGKSKVINSEDDMDLLFEGHDDFEIVFPVIVKLGQDSTLKVNNLQELNALCNTKVTYEDCFDIDFPITVSKNGSKVTINNENELDEFGEAEGDFDLVFPITVTLKNGSKVTINSDDQFFDLCSGDSNGN